MPFMERFTLFIYNLVILAIAGLAVALSLGWNKPIIYLNWATSTPENRLILGAVGVLLVIIVLIMMLRGTSGQVRIDEVIVVRGFPGEVSISIEAIKGIIMKAVKHVEGVKDLRPMVSHTQDGVTVRLHTMIYPEQSVPELAQCLQAVVKERLEKIGGLQVAEIKVLVDEFNPVSK